MARLQKTKQDIVIVQQHVERVMVKEKSLVEVMSAHLVLDMEARLVCHVKEVVLYIYIQKAIIGVLLAKEQLEKNVIYVMVPVKKIIDTLVKSVGARVKVDAAGHHIVMIMKKLAHHVMEKANIE